MNNMVRKLRVIIGRQRWKMKDYIVLTCDVCSRPTFDKNVIEHQLLTGKRVSMCKRCDKRVFPGG